MLYASAIRLHREAGPRRLVDHDRESALPRELRAERLRKPLPARYLPGAGELADRLRDTASVLAALQTEPATILNADY